MSGIRVTVGGDGVQELNRVHSLLSNPQSQRALMKVIGVRAESELRQFWQKRDAETPNKHGWPRQHFWARIAKRTAFDPSKTTETTTTVTVADPALAAKVNGATIHPIPPRKALAIPMRAEAYGVMPSSGLIPGLFVFRQSEHNGGDFLAAKVGGQLEFFYRLVPQAVVPKDPRALPPAEELGAALGDTAGSFFRRNGTGSHGGTN